MGIRYYIEHLRAQEDLFGQTPSDTTLFRAFHEIAPETRDALAEAFAGVRAEVWRRSVATTGTAPVILDIDASLVEIHTETKEGTGPHYKGGWGYHPMFCFADATGEALSGLLRPGNAGANTVADHVRVLDVAVAQLPAPIALGHHVGDDGSLVARELVVRADSAGCTHGFVWACRTRNIGFFVVARSNAQVHAAIFDTVGLDQIWEPAVHQDGSPREGAAVADLSELVDLSEWPPGTRLIVRREPLHPGAQHSLFPSLEYRYWGHYSDQDGEAVELDRTMRCRRGRRAAHRAPEGLGALGLPVLRSRSEPHVDGDGHDGRRPGALVPAALPRRQLGQGTAQGVALGALPRPGTARAFCSPPRRAHPGRLAQCRCAARRLSKTRTHHMNDLASGHWAPTALRRVPNDLPGSKWPPELAPMGHHQTGTNPKSRHRHFGSVTRCRRPTTGHLVNDRS